MVLPLAHHQTRQALMAAITPYRTTEQQTSRQARIDRRGAA
jgi:hypothetical protein